MPTTSKGYPYPAASAANNVPADIQAVSDMLELWPGIPSLTQTQINALSAGAKTTNLHVFNSTTGRTQRWNGAAWIDQVEVTGATFTGEVDVVSATGAGSASARQIWISTAAPSGGADGDLWVTYIP